MARLDVLHLLISAEREGTSMASVVRSLAELADPARYRFHAWFLMEDGPLRAELAEIGVATAYVPWRGWRDFPGGLRTIRALQRGRFPLVHRHTGGRSVGCALRVGTRARVVTHLHALGPEGGDPRPPALRPGTDCVIANSSAHAGLRTRIPVRVIHPGVRTERFAPRPLVAPGAPCVIGAASRLVPLKSLDDLLDAFASVRERQPDARLEIAGDGPLREALETRSCRLGLAGAVAFLGWCSPVADVMSRWTVFAQPSRQEGFGMAALEAMAAGLPVVATAVGGVPDLVVHGVTGYLVPPGDPAALAAALLAVVQAPDAGEGMGRAGRQRATDRFDARRMVENMTDLYERLHRAR